MYKKFLLILATLPLVSCAVVAPLSVIGTGSLIMNERSVGTQVDDKVLLARIKSTQAESKIPKIWMNISVSVLEGRVMLTGAVPTQMAIDEAIKIAWSVQGVKEVINELSIGQLGLTNTARDFFLANQLRAKLVVEKNITSNNYTIAAYNSTLYIMGIAKTEEERQQVILVAKSIDGVIRIVNHVLLENDPRRWNRV